MSKSKEYITNPHILIAIATGISIITLAYFSKKVLREPLHSLAIAAPPFIAAIYEALLAKHEGKKFMQTWIWVIAIWVATSFVIVVNI